MAKEITKEQQEQIDLLILWIELSLVLFNKCNPGFELTYDDVIQSISKKTKT